MWKSTPRASAIFAFAIALVVSAAAGADSHGAGNHEAESHDASVWKQVSGSAFTFTEVRPDVWHIQGTGTPAAGSNGAVIVGERDALLVDSHMTPAAAKALQADLPLITDKPIRYIVNTHFHFDHVQGNQVFGPDVEIIAHEFTRRVIASGDSRRGRGYDFFIGSAPARIESLEKQLESATGEDRQGIERQLDSLRTVWEQDQETELVAPTLALRKQITLYRGGREIRLHFFGRGHTGGDVVVYLPAEKVLVTGDLVTQGVPYMGDAYLLEWADTLEHLTELDVEVVLPGHGTAFDEIERIRWQQHLLRNLWHQIVDQHALGIPADEAAQAIDLTAHGKHYPSISEVGFNLHAVERAYELLDSAGNE